MSDFPVLSRDEAPEEARELLDKAKSAYGFVPNMLGVFAEAPALLKGYMTLSEIFGESSFSPVEQQVVFLATSFENECHYCMAAHSGIAKQAGVPEDAVEALRDGKPIPDDKLEALRAFTTAMASKRGWVDDKDIEAFLDAGYSKQNVLEVVLGIAVKTMSNYTNHIAETPVDEPLKDGTWKHPDKRKVA